MSKCSSLDYDLLGLGEWSTGRLSGGGDFSGKV